jgi:hypothetical protein
MASALEMEKPQDCFSERCYYYDVKENNGMASVGIYNKDINKGLIMTYDKATLPCFTEWKMMGKTDYVLGLEPGNLHPCGRANARNNGILQFLQPDEKFSATLEFSFLTDKSNFDKEF